MAYPVIRINASTGYSGNSGAGPDPAITGGGASTSADGKTVYLPSETDLSGVASDGSAAIYLQDSTAGNRNFGRITSVDNVNKTVGVDLAFGSSLSGLAWGIGGKRDSLNDAATRKLASNNGGAGDFRNGWIIELETDVTITSAITIIPASTADVFVLRGDSKTSRRVITQSANARHFVPSTTASGWYRLENLQFKNSNATPDYVIYQLVSSYVVVVNCVCGGNDGVNSPKGLATNVGTYFLFDTAILRCTSWPIGAGLTVYAVGCDISRNLYGTDRLAIGCVFLDCIISHNTLHGLQLYNSGVVAHCTIHGNGGAGINFPAGTTGQMQIIDNQITGNGGYGISSSSGVPTIRYNNFGNASDGTLNTSGNVIAAMLPLEDTNTNDPPGYVDKSASVRNFQISASVKDTGFPSPGKTIGAGQSGTTGYTDIGCAQRPEGGVIIVEDE